MLVHIIMLYCKDIFALTMGIELATTEIKLISQFSCKKNINILELLFIIFHEGDYADTYASAKTIIPLHNETPIRKTFIEKFYELLKLQLQINFYILEKDLDFDYFPYINKLEEEKVSFDKNSSVLKDPLLSIIFEISNAIDKYKTLNNNICSDEQSKFICMLSSMQPFLDLIAILYMNLCKSEKSNFINNLFKLFILSKRTFLDRVITHDDMESIEYYDKNNMDYSSMLRKKNILPNSIYIFLTFERTFLYNPCYIENTLTFLYEDLANNRKHNEMIVKQILVKHKNVDLFIHVVKFTIDHEQQLKYFLIQLLKKNIKLKTINYATISSKKKFRFAVED